jgi:FKBP-type peptidyl-prolyl cis-trans isomerase
MIGVTYSGWVEEDGKIGKIFDSNAERGVLFKMNVGAGKVIKVCAHLCLQ